MHTFAYFFGYFWIVSDTLGNLRILWDIVKEVLLLLTTLKKEKTLGYFWLLFAFFGYFLLPFATYGYFCLLLATFGYLWLCLAYFSYFLLLLATLCHFWLLLTKCCYLWRLFATFGYFRLSARVLATQPLNGRYEIDEGGHMKGC